jgi:hypothetical protein
MNSCATKRHATETRDAALHCRIAPSLKVE